MSEIKILAQSARNALAQDYINMVGYKEIIIAIQDYIHNLKKAEIEISKAISLSKKETAEHETHQFWVLLKNVVLKTSQNIHQSLPDEIYSAIQQQPIDANAARTLSQDLLATLKELKTIFSEIQNQASWLERHLDEVGYDISFHLPYDMIDQYLNDIEQALYNKSFMRAKKASVIKISTPGVSPTTTTTTPTTTPTTTTPATPATPAATTDTNTSASASPDESAGESTDAFNNNQYVEVGQSIGYLNNILSTLKELASLGGEIRGWDNYINSIYKSVENVVNYLNIQKQNIGKKSNNSKNKIIIISNYIINDLKNSKNKSEILIKIQQIINIFQILKIDNLNLDHSNSLNIQNALSNLVIIESQLTKNAQEETNNKEQSKEQSNTIDKEKIIVDYKAFRDAYAPSFNDPIKLPGGGVIDINKIIQTVDKAFGLNESDVTANFIAKKIVVSKIIKISASSSRSILEALKQQLENLKTITSDPAKIALLDNQIQQIDNALKTIPLDADETRIEIIQNLQFIMVASTELKNKFPDPVINSEGKRVQKTMVDILLKEIKDNAFEAAKIINSTSKINIPSLGINLKSKNTDAIIDDMYSLITPISSKINLIPEWGTSRKLSNFWGELVSKITDLYNNYKTGKELELSDADFDNIKENYFTKFITPIYPAIKQFKEQYAALVPNIDTILDAIQKYIGSEGVDYREVLTPRSGQNFSKMVTELQTAKEKVIENSQKAEALYKSYNNVLQQINNEGAKRGISASLIDDAKSMLIKISYPFGIPEIKRFMSKLFTGKRMTEKEIQIFIDKQIIGLNKEFETFEQNLLKSSTDNYNKLYTYLKNTHTLSRLAYSLIPVDDGAYKNLQSATGEGGTAEGGEGGSEGSGGFNANQLIQMLNTLLNSGKVKPTITLEQLVRELSRGS